jgi:predicted  nucleic acid-binding Zn-ribbon protein
VNIYLKQIIELSEIDNEIAEFEPKIEEIKRSYSDVTNGRKSILKEIGSIENTIKEINKRISACEVEIANAQDKEKEYEEKLKSVTKERELTSLNIESNLKKTTIEYNNDEIAKLQKRIDGFEKNLKEKQDELALFEEKVSSAEQGMEEKLKNLAEEQEKVKQDRADMIANLKEEKLITFYEKIRRWAGKTTVVPVKKGACYGCFIKLADQTHLEVIKGEEIITCPNCGRVLYLEQEEENEEK